MAMEDVSGGKDKAVWSNTDHPALIVSGSWQEVFQGQAKAALETVLPGYMYPRRWFGSKARTIQATEIMEAVAVGRIATLALVRVTYTEGEAETYLLPLTFTSGEQAENLRRERPQAVVTSLQTRTTSGILYDAVWENRFGEALLEMMAQQQTLPGNNGEIVASATAVFPHLRGPSEQSLPPALLGAEQSNTSIRYGERLILKLFRRLEAGTNPDLEIGYFLTQKAAFAHIPPVAGALEYRRPGSSEPITLAILQGFVPNQGDAWRYTLEALSQYFERVLNQTQVDMAAITLPGESMLDLAQQDVPQLACDLIGGYLESAQLLGQRTAELHLALASGGDDPGFAPEAFNRSDQERLHQDMQNLTGRIFQLLRQRLPHLPETIRAEGQQVLALEGEILRRFHSLLEGKMTAMRIRTHGDYHLGQVLYTGHDFMMIDFEGEPARPLPERRLKRSPLQDVAGMLRSFHYAAYAAFFEQEPGLEAWTRFWHLWVSVAFLKTYLEVVGAAPFHPQSLEEVRILLNAYLLEKAVYELGYELNNRPDWVKIPLQGIRQTLQVRPKEV